MWELTVKRRYDREYSTYEGEDMVYFKSKHLDELTIIIEKFEKFGIKGKYEYKIIKEEGEEECSNHTTN